MAGKGSKPRPVDKKKYQSEFDRIFGGKSSENDKSRARHSGVADKPSGVS